jgi:hypothetical protein
MVSLLSLLGKGGRPWGLRLLEICQSGMVLCWEAVLELLTHRVYTQSVHSRRLVIRLRNLLRLRLVVWGRLLRVGFSLNKRLQYAVKCLNIRELRASLIFEDDV